MTHNPTVVMLSSLKPFFFNSLKNALRLDIIGFNQSSSSSTHRKQERVTARDAQIVQTTGNLHHLIRNALGGEPQDIFDNPTAFDASDDVFHHDARRGDNPVQQAVAHAQGVGVPT